DRLDAERERRPDAPGQGERVDQDRVEHRVVNERLAGDAPSAHAGRIAGIHVEDEAGLVLRSPAGRILGGELGDGEAEAHEEEETAASGHQIPMSLWSTARQRSCTAGIPAASSAARAP